MMITKKITCKVCGSEFPPKKEGKYIVQKSGLNTLMEGVKSYECFDCPECGCQNIVNIREGGVPDDECDSDKMEQGSDDSESE